MAVIIPLGCVAYQFLFNYDGSARMYYWLYYWFLFSIFVCMTNQVSNKSIVIKKSELSPKIIRLKIHKWSHSQRLPKVRFPFKFMIQNLYLFFYYFLLLVGRDLTRLPLDITTPASSYSPYITPCKVLLHNNRMAKLSLGSCWLLASTRVLGGTFDETQAPRRRPQMGSKILIVFMCPYG